MTRTRMTRWSSWSRAGPSWCPSGSSAFTHTTSGQFTASRDVKVSSPLYNIFMYRQGFNDFDEDGQETIVLKHKQVADM